VEIVNIPDPAAGLWALAVTAHHVPGTPTEVYSDHQGFALVATYADCSSSLPPVTGLSANDNGQTGVDLAWDASSATSYQVYRAPGSCGQEPGEFHFAGQASGNAFTDTAVQGGYGYAYVVRTADACSEGAASGCAAAAYSGDCTLFPEFAGLASAQNDASSPSCAVRLAWPQAVSRCPLSAGISYNVYRGVSPYFTPGASSRIVTGVTDTTYVDDAVAPLVTYYYVVRAEDGTAENGGPANGGNEDQNSAWRSATPYASASAPGTWSDDGGDTRAFLTLEPPWTVTNQEDHTPAGALCYHTAPDGQSYPANRCAGATTPPIPLQEGAPVLSYWARFNLEFLWDGVVVELSVDGNPTWIPADPVNGYPSSFAYTGDPPVNACLYPASQGCFSGPTGNGALTPWTQYRHDLTDYAGRTVQVRWRFSSDPGTEYEGFYLDDIAITDASVPGACEGHSDQPPVVHLLAPAAGSTVHGLVALSAEASDDRGLANVKFLVDDAVLATLETPPFEATWDTSGQSGSHTVRAQAQDNLGQISTTDPITVTAENPTASAVKKLADPFRLSLAGTGFEEGCRILVGGTQAPETARKSDTKAVAKKGSALKALVPKGSQVPVVLVNPDGGRTAPVTVSR
jgi:hypothetical protein